MDERLLSRVEDASINASAAPQQLWLDGWLVRSCPGKARRSRCVHAVAIGRMPLEHRLALAAEVYRAAGLPMLFRMTPFSMPRELDAQLAASGWAKLDETSVMLLPQPAATPDAELPADLHWLQLDAAAYAEAVGELRGSTPEQRHGQGARVAACPVPYEGHAICDAARRVLACGQFARESEVAGLYDIHTREDHRGRGLASAVCKRLLSRAAMAGATLAYLQTEADNHPARRVYERLGFREAYRYHYRCDGSEALAAAVGQSPA